MAAIFHQLTTLFQDGVNVYAILVSFLILGCLFVWQLRPTKIRDPREPPVFKSRIPYIGHLLGMIIYQAEYLTMLASASILPHKRPILIIFSSRTNWPIFSLKIFSGQLYVITSPDLIQAVFKAPKVFSFDKISIDASEKIFGFTERQVEILSRGGVKDTENAYPLAKDVAHLMHQTLQASDALLEMNTRALNRFAKFLEPVGKEEMPLRLMAWLRHTFTLSTMSALYGDINPVSEDNSLIQALL
jgi:hypothetical protein